MNWANLVDDIKLHHILPYLTFRELLRLDTASSSNSVTEANRDGYIEMLRCCTLPELTKRNWVSISSLHWLQKRGILIPNLRLDQFNCSVNSLFVPRQSHGHTIFINGFKNSIFSDYSEESGLTFLQPVEKFTRQNYLELRPALICTYIKYSRTRQIKEFYAQISTEEYPGFSEAKKHFLNATNECILSGYIELFGKIDFNIIKYLIESKTYDINERHNHGDTILLKSCMEDAVDETRWLVQQGAETDVEDDEGMNCLLLASKFNRIETLEYLLVDVKMDIDQTSNLSGRSALDTAIIFGNIETVKFLLDKGASLNRSGKRGRTPFMWGLAMVDLDIIDLLMKESNCDVTLEQLPYQTTEMQRPLMCLVTVGFKKLWRHNRSSIREKTSYGFFAEVEMQSGDSKVRAERDRIDSSRIDRVLSLLLNLIEKGCMITGIPVLSSTILLILNAEKYSTRGEHLNRMAVIKGLIKIGAIIEDSDLSKVFWGAILSNNISIVDLLRENGYSLMREGRSMLHDFLDDNLSRDIIGAKLEDTEIVEVLLKKGVDVNQQNVDGETAGHLACRRDDYQELIPILLKFGADFSIKNQGGDSVYHAAITHDCTDLFLNGTLSLVDKHDLFGWVRPKTGNSFLHTTIENADSELVTHILKCVPIAYNLINLKNKKGLTPLSMCCKRGMHKVIPLLVDLGADVNGGVCLYTGNTALHDAAQIGFIETVSVLLKYHANAEIKNKHGLRAVELATEHSIIVLLRGETRETIDKQPLLVQFINRFATKYVR